MSKEKVMIVDDEEGIRNALLGILEDEGYTAECAVSGEECIEKVAQGEFDCVILDVWLPGMDGLETLEELRKVEFQGAIVIISGHGSIEAAVKATKLGAFDFLEKPLSLEKTVLVVKNATRQKKLEEENRALREKFEQKNILIGECESVKKLRDDVETADPAGDAKARFLFAIEAADGYYRTVFDLGQERLSGRVESVTASTEIVQQPVDHVVALLQTRPENLLPFIFMEFTNRGELFHRYSAIREEREHHHR